MNRQSLRNSTLGAALALGLVSAGTASAHLPSATLAGRAAPGDSVTVRNVATEHHLQKMVEKNGRYRFPRLPIGVYEVVIHHPDGSMDAPIFARARLGETVQVTTFKHG